MVERVAWRRSPGLVKPGGSRAEDDDKKRDRVKDKRARMKNEARESENDGNDQDDLKSVMRQVEQCQDTMYRSRTIMIRRCRCSAGLLMSVTFMGFHTSACVGAWTKAHTQLPR